MRSVSALASVMIAALLGLGISETVSGSPFYEAVVQERAQALAATPYHAPEPLPEVWRKLNYDQYRAIRPIPEKALWRDTDSPFRLEFFHPGYLFKRAVKFHVISADGEERPIPFERERFDYGDLVLKDGIETSGLDGYAGFRIQYPLHDQSDNFDEIGSFVGASYFRLLGEGQRYGLSARGLALNVASANQPEEFPVFVEYWLVEPTADAESLEFYALLDSPSVSGAYHFEVFPGERTQARVDVTLYFREEVGSVGLAPLTSMFWYGENSAERGFAGWRPEVHDSDGLLFQTWNDETVWRPLYNHHAIRYSHYLAPDVRGFGLFQRDREFHHYEDLTNPYQLTPSAWIEPVGKWGKGAIRLVELPTDNEGIDNVVSFFEPEEKPKAGDSFTYAYDLAFVMKGEVELSRDRVEATRVGVDPTYPDTRRFAIDFNGPALQTLSADAPVFAEIRSSANGFIDENQCFKNVMTGGWRVEFKLDTDDDNVQPVELRCFLRTHPDNQILTETWSYQWSP
ncbi:MAG: glucan biosynthesis protein G [Verrucomicrobiae bacterium]|nr:glucan biosynthesis protein G [Verrucomicrobiae bacterium]